VIALKINYKKLLTHLPKILCTVLLITVILLNPKTASDGIKNGITLLLTTVIPSLFPFLVIASYIASSDAFKMLSGIFAKITKVIFKLSPDGFIPILMGLLGGYPIGAKITADLYKSNRITQNEAERLMYFTVNSGPAFTITAVGVGMLHNYYSGVILYLSNILTALVMGFLCRFLSDNKASEAEKVIPQDKAYAFINSVSSGANAIINISAWVLTFSCISGIIESFNLNTSFELFLNAILEVTNGCKVCSKETSLPVISAILGFGSLSVICQVSPYFSICKVKLQNFIVSRILNSSLSAFFTFQLLNIFPKAQETVIIYSDSNGAIGISYTVGVTVILIIMCVFFILQVDNRKKVW